MAVLRNGNVPNASRDEECSDMILRDAVEKGIINLKHVADMLEVKRRKELLESCHVWQGKNGYFYTRLTDSDGQKKLVRKKEKKDLEDVIVEHALKADNRITFEQAFSMWNNNRAALGFIEESTRGVNEDLFNRFLKDLGAKDLKTLTPVAVAKFLERLPKVESMTAKAFSNVKGIVMGTLMYARREGFINFYEDDVKRELIVPEKVFRKVRHRDDEESFTDVEMDMIIDHVTSHSENIRNLAVLLIAITGMRIGEVVALAWEYVGDGYLNVVATETRYKDEDGKWLFTVRDAAKTPAGERAVPIPRDYQWIWDAVRAVTGNAEGFVFVNESGERMNAQSIRAHVRRMCDKLKIPRRSPHKFRKTYCTKLFENNTQPKVIESMMGHVDVSISDRFYNKDRGSIEDKIDIVSDIFRKY